MLAVVIAIDRSLVDGLEKKDCRLGKWVKTI